MYATTKKFEMQAVHEQVSIQRNKDGIPTVAASNREDLCFGIGYTHATDRVVQLMLVRAIAQGRASEKFVGSDELIEIDKFMRWLHLEKDMDAEAEKLLPEAKSQMKAYCDGINAALSEKRRPLEFLMVGYRPEDWAFKDSLITAKVMGYIGLAQAQGDMEKFLIQMIQHGIDPDRIKELFPYITEDIDYDLIKEIQSAIEMVPGQLWQGILPNLRASNNWVVSGTKTKSGHPILASDPHMEVNRLPALWYEMIWRVGDEVTIGITMPGLPVMVFGRTNYLAWAGTYGFMDLIDYFIEEYRDEKFLYDNKWVPFDKRTETIRPKKREPINLTFYENHHGVLEGQPERPGKYLSMAFAGRSGVGADIFNAMMEINGIRTVKEAQEQFRNIAVPAFNWVFVDRDGNTGNIGYQMNGRMPKRREGISGLLPIPGWEPDNDWQGFEDPDQLPRCYNPESGFFATANNDLNAFGDIPPINLPMAPYRFQRINERLEQEEALDIAVIKDMHFDLYSKQAERLMPLIRPLLPDTESGKILKEWDFTYQKDSKGAMLFESVYHHIIRTVFGKYGMGEKVIEHLFDETAIFTDFYGNFDDVLVNESSSWFKEVDRTTQLKEAISRGLNVQVKPYGETRKFDMMNIFLGGKLPGFLGFDVKNMTLPGNRATIPQGQIFNNAGRTTTFSPSFRMIVEIEKDGIWTNIAGGPSGNRFSRWYKSDLENWERGKYKKLE